MVGRRQRACFGHCSGHTFAGAGRLRSFFWAVIGTVMVAMTGKDCRRSFGFMKITKLLSAMLLSGMLVGCMVGPKYHRPTVQTPAAYRDLSENPQLQTQTASYADLP